MNIEFGFNNLNFKYKKELLFQSFSVRFKTSQFTTVLGPSGCGKSTLLRLLAGIEEPSKGSLFSSFTSDLIEARKIGFAFQEAQLLPWLDVLENVMLPLKLGIALPDGQAQARYWIETLGLTPSIQKYPQELSGGMKMRVSIARALVLDPELILMDEPFSALDEPTRHSLQEKVRSVFEATKKTVLFVTHSISEAAFISDRIIGLSSKPVKVHFDINIATGIKRDLQFRFSQQYMDFQKELTKNVAL